MGKYGKAGKARQQPLDALPRQAIRSVVPANSIRRHQPPTNTIARSPRRSLGVGGSICNKTASYAENTAYDAALRLLPIIERADFFQTFAYFVYLCIRICGIADRQHQPHIVSGGNIEVFFELGLIVHADNTACQAQ